jgi:hypothetical protein
MIKGIPVEKLMYNPPTPPVMRPAQGPAKTPLRNIGNWVKCIEVEKGPSGTGITNGGIDSMFDRAAIKAAKVSFLVFIYINNH